MAEAPRSISVFIDPTTKNVGYEFMPQELHPQQYGAVIGGLIVHIARCFVASNPGATEDELLAAIRAGIDAAIEQRDACDPPSVVN